ncbi:MAG: hypothetical protein DMG06_07025 [Acidobacteria bacterium]|nr:MAG: hypothetical protein DMG06_07025 [Acidobacteriota bacterium]
MQRDFSFSEATLNLGSEAISPPFQKTVYRTNRSCRNAAWSATTLFHSYPYPPAFICVQAFSSCLRVSVAFGCGRRPRWVSALASSIFAKRYRAIYG